jgi:hypothetical protein
MGVVHICCYVISVTAAGLSGLGDFKRLSTRQFEVSWSTYRNI